jgi:hypothetical protein
MIGLSVVATNIIWQLEHVAHVQLEERRGDELVEFEDLLFHDLVVDG